MGTFGLHQFTTFAFLAALLASGCAPEADEPIVQHAGGGIERAAGGPAGRVAAYPGGPYGHRKGAVVQNFKFTGFVNPMEADFVADANTVTTISLADYYNPEGHPSRPLALLVNASALWCSVCRQEAASSMGHYRHWKPKGVEFITAIFEDDESNPAQLADIEYWAERFELEYPVVLDPGLKLGAFFDQSASPFNMIINTRTMEVVFAETGLVNLGPTNKTLQKLVRQ